MRISIFGLGYVGCVSLGCFAQNGHNVMGVDISPHKVALINEGKPTIIEKDIDLIIEKGFTQGYLSATQDYKNAVINTDISLICVGTPSSKEGHLDLSYIYKVAQEIAEGIKDKKTFHVVVIRSTVLPGTNKKVSNIIEKVSNKKANVDFAVVSNPEFLREGSAVNDFYNPAVTVIGTESDEALNIMKELYNEVIAPIEITDIEVAEIIKYINNSYHALKITFGNEVGNICKKLGIDSHKVMDLFCKDSHLNISPAYFKPGFAYGGSCLPKDLKGLRSLAQDNYLKVAILEAIDTSNENQKKIAIDIIQSKGKKKIGILGLSFKTGTDDLRYSPSVELAEYFLGKGFQVNIFDNNVSISNITGTNKQFIEEHIPHLSKLLLNSIDELFINSEVIVITQKHEELMPLLQKFKDIEIVDLIRVKEEISFPNYEGICW
jgi:GDP-mannose 6-dehydrogenase